MELKAYEIYFKICVNICEQVLESKGPPRGAKSASKYKILFIIFVTFITEYLAYYLINETILLST